MDAIRQIYCAPWKQWFWEHYLTKTELDWHILEIVNDAGVPLLVVCLHFSVEDYSYVNDVCEYVADSIRASMN